MANSTLAAIEQKVRRLTRNPSKQQLSQAEIYEAVNTFIEYDLPSHLRLFDLRKTLTFYTEPNIDRYETNTTDNTSPLYQFKQDKITINGPIYIGGFEALYTQSQQQFFGIYPKINFNLNTGSTGDGVTLTFSGTLSQAPFVRNMVTFGSQDSNGNGLVLKDVPFNATSGNLVVPNQDAPAALDANNNINYITGAFTCTFPTAPATAETIWAAIVPYTASRPEAMLYYDSVMTLRPVPDKVYPVTIDVYQRPTELLKDTSKPELEQWWQYIAYGAAKKIFEDRGDLEDVQLIMPEFKEQETLVMRRTIMQNTQQRVQTIYSEQTSLFGSFGFNQFSGK